jgi:hypothetical protein
VFTKVENLSISSRTRNIIFVVCDHDLGVRVMKAVRDSPSSDGACVYEVSSNYVERIKRYGPDKQKVNGHMDGHTDGHTDGRTIHAIP